jgi:hypothetical protein
MDKRPLVYGPLNGDSRPTFGFTSAVTELCWRLSNIGFVFGHIVVVFSSPFSHSRILHYANKTMLIPPPTPPTPPKPTPTHPPASLAR